MTKNIESSRPPTINHDWRENADLRFIFVCIVLMASILGLIQASIYLIDTGSAAERTVATSGPASESRKAIPVYP